MAEANDNDNNAANGGANGGGDGDDYVVLDGKGEEMTMTSTNASLSPEHDLKSLSYLMEIFTIFIVAGGSFTALIHHNDVLALKISMSFLLVQLAFAVNKKRPFGLPVMKFLAGKGVNAALHETIEERNRFTGQLSTTYVIKYDAFDEEEGTTVTILKALKPNVFTLNGSKEIAREVARDIGIVTRVQVAKGYPRSAHPRRSLLSRYEALRIWNLYFMPVLFLTFIGVVFNIFFSCSIQKGTHMEGVFQTLVLYGFVYPIVLGPLAFVNYYWSEEVLFGGEEVSKAGNYNGGGGSGAVVNATLA
mmetsp:Transcript_10090/g.11228  ORF Transcript_10090/g.11228 Transcript_10090/m.11228 type:complete len:304 (-) Transcript_10090:313-1224(-)